MKDDFMEIDKGVDKLESLCTEYNHDFYKRVKIKSPYKQVKIKTSDRHSLKILEAPLCFCGCKKPVKWNLVKNDWNKYVIHHWRNAIIKVQGMPPLCFCGCGTLVRWRSGGWQKFAKGCWGFGKST